MNEVMEVPAYENKIELHGHGHVWLESWMGGDADIANSARVSVDDYTDDQAKNDGLVRRLYRDKHGTPFEDVVFKFDIKLPLAMAREFQRHRVPWSYSEKSMRYVETDGQFYIPDADHIRQQVGKSMSYTYEPVERHVAVDVQDIMEDAYDHAMLAYRSMLDMGIAKEVARFVLPVGMFTHMKARTNLRGLMAFLSLRNHPAAQQEIREIAEAMEQLAFHVAPVAMQAFVDGGRVAP
jgi:thymidylate synthase (FAD)